MEYIGRALLAEKGIAVPRAMVVDRVEELAAVDLAYPVVVKAQVAVGGRGKAGGVRAAGDAAEMRRAVSEILGMDIRGHRVERVLIVEKVEAVRELFVSIILDREKKVPVVVFSTRGGVDIEEVAKDDPEAVARAAISPMVGVREHVTRYLIDRSRLEPSCFEALHDVLVRLYAVWWDFDCLLAEINPLMLDGDGRLVAADARINIDDSALPVRQTKILGFRDSLEREAKALEARQYGFLFIPVRADGAIAIMSNGSGMLMASLDTLQRRGMWARSVLDLGGGATAERIAEGIRLVMDQPGVQGLFANIFGGITRCDEIAAGVRTAAERLSDGQFIVIRMEGTNKAKGREILAASASDRVLTVERLSEAAAVMAERMGRA